MGNPVLQRYGKGKSRLTCKVAVDGVLLTAVWFNRHFLQDQLDPRPRDYADRQMGAAAAANDGIGFRISRIAARREAGTLQPVYSVGGSITQPWMRKTIGQALTQYGTMIEEMLPA